jgi:uncharacterized protein (DUF2062 family)
MKYRYRLLLRFRPVLRFIKFRVLHIDDSPQQIARGVAAGVFTAFLPFLGFHIPITLLLAVMTRANKLIALLTVWISNPLTFVFIYYPCYLLGRVLVQFYQNKPRFELEQIQAMFEHTFSLNYMFSHLFTIEYWKQASQVFTQIGLEMFFGGIILGTFAANIAYWNAYYFIIGYRTRKQARKSARRRSFSEKHIIKK